MSRKHLWIGARLVLAALLIYLIASPLHWHHKWRCGAYVDQPHGARVISADGDWTIELPSKRSCAVWGDR